MGYEELMAEVKRLARAALDARFRGDLRVNKIRAQAYADGYMRALGDAGLLGRDELLQAVAEARVELFGAATEQRALPSSEAEPSRAATG